MPNQPTYVPVNCWKCRTQNNAALGKICRSCGVYLRNGPEILRKDRYTDPISEHPSFRGFVWSGLAVVLICAGMIYFYKREGPPPELPAAEKAALPPDSWYNQSWWSYINKYPSARQIVQKSNESAGKIMSPQTARTFWISGKMSHAQGACFAQLCMDDEAPVNTNQVHTPEYVPRKTKPVTVGERLGPVTSDNYRNLSFSEFGSIEVGAKIPDKIVKKAHARPPYGGPYRAIEIVEVFNGFAGRKTVDFYAADDKPAKSDVEVMDAQKVESARAELASLWASDFADHTELRLRGIEKVNDRAAFAVASKNKKGLPETHFFDCVTGFVIKIETTELSTFLEDYRPYQQGMLPFTMYYRRPEPGGYHSWIRFEVSEWKIGGYLDDSMFEIPLS